ncbi:MAG: glycosyltransferase family 1 protein [Candidatus Paceibacterota bacterium]|jgi:glycosyltransferase involved in cell wall biosynthesis
MIVIAAKNAFLKNRTGIEEYTFQLVNNLRKIEKKEEIFIYTNKIEEKVDFPLNFHLKIIHFPILWTQIGLSLQMIKWRLTTLSVRSLWRRRINDSRFTTKLFIPAHVIPLIHPKHTIVTIHGLEYEYFPQYYSWFSRKYLRLSTRYATKHAFKIITVSENTKQDLIKLYKCPSEKIEVIWHGVVQIKSEKLKVKSQSAKFKINKPYFLYLGRIELKKNVVGIVGAFKKFKIQESQIVNRKSLIANRNKPQNISYKLILAGGRGYGYQNIKYQISNIKKNVRKDIIFTDHVSGDEKWQLLRNAEALVFPSFYEGFGLPILEAQSVGIPVITSKRSSMEEITTLNRESLTPCLPAGMVNRESQKAQSALLVDPNKPGEIADAMREIVNDSKLRDELIRLGYENAKRFSWKKTARKTLDVLNF